MQPLPGFRDFLPADCAKRNYIFAKWREVARRYGFVEWDGPILEPTDLYRKKSGDEIVAQLFNFTDKGDREVALRPELTPTLARVVAAHEREFKKPLKWFSIGQFFRYEKQQRGRLREHYQLNCDIVGESSLAADIELIALCIDVLRAFGFTEKDFRARINDRNLWNEFLKQNGVEQTSEFLQVVDKLDRLTTDELESKLEPFKMSVATLSTFLVSGNMEMAKTLGDGLANLGLAKYVAFELRVVRGLAYYTGTVFEVFDDVGKLRAIAGGGRYDNLVGQLSDGAVKMPALGFAMGDVVLGELIEQKPAAREQMQKHIASAADTIHIYVVIAKEARRADALAQIQQFRDAGYRVDYPLTAEKVARQFQTAEQLGARIAILFGDEWPEVKLKFMAGGQQELVPHDRLLAHLQGQSSLSSWAERSGVEGSR